MSRTMMRGALLALVAVAAFVSGVSIGQRRSMDMLLSMMASETTGNLAQRVETLARIRTGRSSQMARDSSGVARVGECEWIVG